MGNDHPGWKWSSTYGVTANFGQQAFAYTLPDGYEGLYQKLAGYQVAGGYFYDENNQRAVRGSDLIKRFWY